jgi:peptide/nickel transport system substrate-binding protein
MRRAKGYSKYVLCGLLLFLIVALVAACGPAPAEPVPVPQEEAQPAPEDTTATEVEEEAVATEEVAPEAEEETAMEEEAEDEPGETLAEAQEAESLKASALEGGATIITDEPDVSELRSEYGGDYRDVDSSDAVSFHPYTTVDSTSWGYQGLVYDGSLLRLDEDTLEYIPNMAEEYSISEDGLTFTFKLRDDLEWSDGEPLTAQDYKWTYEQIIKPENEYPYLEQFEFITSYEALDDHTLEIKIDEIYAPALGQMSGLVTPLPQHVWEDLDWTDPEKNPEINNPTVFSGPYKLTEWQRDQFAVFEANENYWYHGRPNFDKYTIEIVPDDDISFEKMKSGESDTAYISPERLEEAKQLDNINVYEWWSPAASWSYVAYNMREGLPTNDIRVRHAINYAIDKDLMTEEIMLGQARRMCSMYADTLWVYNPDVPCYDYDPDKAVELLAEAGYTLNDAGEMVDESGKQLTLRFLYGPNTNQVRELIAVTMQDYLADIGIDVEIQGLEWASYLEAKRAEDPQWDLTTGTWGGVLEPHIMFTLFSEENIPDLNFMNYVNKDVEKLFEEGGATYDIDVRKEKYGEAQEIIAEESPYMFLFYSKSRSGQNKRIDGIEPKLLHQPHQVHEHSRHPSRDRFLQEGPHQRQGRRGLHHRGRACQRDLQRVQQVLRQ